MADDPDAVVIDKLNDKIVFKNISFSYENKIILKDFSLNLKKGQTIALVGASGSGKTTVANLLNRFYDINNGALTIDGIAINKIKKSSLYGLTGMVTQDSILFNDTVRNNISLGNPDASEKEIEEAAKIANAEEFILNLENGYETVIGESGNKLSGGQKQRLSIARAILKNPDVLILDEATSALDTASEKLVQNALEYLMKNRTSLVIAHRLSTIQKADLIVVMNNGEIVETGDHKSLMGVDSTYKKLVDLQTF